MAAHDWSEDVFEAMRGREIATVATVPDGGLTRLLKRCEADAGTRVVTLTTEEEGVGVLAGLWLGGQRAMMALQSSGVGNCINALGYCQTLRAPCLMLVTVRGQWGEFNPWQVPMGQATRAVLEGVTFALRDCRDALAATGTDVSALTATGGGARSDYWLRAIATALDVPVILPQAGDFGAAFGAAVTGDDLRARRVGGGHHLGLDAPARQRRVDELGAGPFLAWRVLAGDGDEVARQPDDQVEVQPAKQGVQVIGHGQCPPIPGWEARQSGGVPARRRSRSPAVPRSTPPPPRR